VRAAAGTRLRQGCGAQGGLPALTSLVRASDALEKSAFFP
jgi:hypothetical protein